MFDILLARLDYIHFLHGLCLFFLAAMCVFVLRRGGQLRWRWLGLFALCQLGAIALLLVGGGDFLHGAGAEALAVGTPVLRGLAFGFLLLFGLWTRTDTTGQRGAVLAGLYLVVVVLVGWFVAGAAGIDAATRLVLAPVAGVVAMRGLVRVESGDVAAKSYSVRPLLGLYILSLTCLPAFHLLLLGGLTGWSSVLSPLPGEIYVPLLALILAFLDVALAACTVFLPQNMSVTGPSRHVRPVRSKRPVSLYLTMATVAVALLLGALLTESMGENARRTIRRQLLLRASSLGAALPASEVDMLSIGPEASNIPAYAALHNRLDRMRAQNPDLGFVAILELRRDDGKVRMLLDTDPADSDGFIRPGEVYDEAPQEMLEVLADGRIRLSGIYEDRRGMWISGMAPVMRSYGGVAGAVMLGVSARAAASQVAEARLTGILISFLLGIIAAGGGILTQRNKQLAVTNAILVDEVESRVLAQERLGEAKRQAEEASRAKGEFLAHMSHEIRTPMTVIIGVGDLLAQADFPEEHAHQVDLLRSCGEGLLAVINDILDLSRAEAGGRQLEESDFDLFSLVAAVGEVMRLKAEQSGVALHWSVEEDVPRFMRGDQGCLRQVLLNLVSNAVKFTEYGEVSIKVAVAETKVNTGPDERLRLLFCVRDSGVGIPEDKVEDIFKHFTQADPSTTRRFGGTGLGLPICKNLVALMGGEMEVRSVEGMGSTFCFTALFAPGVDPAAHAPERFVADAPGPSAHILIVEDSLPVRRLLETLMATTAHRCRLAPEGESGLRAFADEEFDLVFVDIEMPGIDGFETCRRMRRFEREHGRPPATILAFSAHTSEHFSALCDEAGFDGLVTKPFRPSQLLERIRSLMTHN